MEIFFKILTGTTITLNAEPSDTIADIKQNDSIQRLGQVRFVFAGKILEDHRTLKSYNIQKLSTIHVVIKFGTAHARNQSVWPPETAFVEKQEVKERIRELTEKARSCGFDPDIALVDPCLHHEHLAGLEQDVVENSAWYRCNGEYTNYPSEMTVFTFALEIDSNMAPSWMRNYMQQIQSRVDHPSYETLHSIRVLYPMICRLSANFDLLHRSECCGDYYSIILEQDDDVAEIVKIPKTTLEALKMSVEVTTALLCDDSLPPGDADSHSLEFMEQACDSVLNVLHITPPETRQSKDDVLALFRSIVLLLDLGLVSYVGSHASRFDLDHLPKDAEHFGVHERAEIFGFTCSRRRLACLDGLLDHDEVWSFRCCFGGTLSNEKPDTRMSILTRIEEFADIWGPVWSIHTHSEGQPVLIKQYNLTNGIICRVGDKSSREDGAIRCHWYGFDTHQRRRNDALAPLSKSLTLSPGDLLLIGARFRDKSDCKYTLDEFETTYGHAMGILGPERSIWELDEREVGLSFNKVIGIQISGKQKRRPQTTLKQSILAKWKMGPQTANPAILNQYLGVEVSHCTGNARRVPVRHLLLMQPIKRLLDLQFPKWVDQPWGRAFKTALSSADQDLIFNVWTRYESHRYQMATLVTYVLELLDKTGTGRDGFVVGFFNGSQELSVTFDKRRNDWSSLLADSHLTASYAIVNNTCIECYTPEHSTSVCGNRSVFGNRSARTVLDTRLAVPAGRTSDPLERPPDKIRIEPSGQILKTVTRLGTGSLFMIPSSAVSAIRARMLSRVFDDRMASGREIRELGAKGGRQYQVYVSSTEGSYGGMEVQRFRQASKMTSVKRSGFFSSTPPTKGAHETSALPSQTSNKSKRPHDSDESSQRRRQRMRWHNFSASTSVVPGSTQPGTTVEHMTEGTSTFALSTAPATLSEAATVDDNNAIHSNGPQSTSRSLHESSMSTWLPNEMRPVQISNEESKVDHRKLDCNVSSIELPNISFGPMDWSFENNN